MNAAAEARLSELDRVLDAREFTADLAAELFAVADLLTGQTQLRNAVADPTSSADQRRELASAVLGSRVSADAAAVAERSEIMGECGAGLAHSSSPSVWPPAISQPSSAGPGQPWQARTPA